MLAHIDWFLMSPNRSHVQGRSFMISATIPPPNFDRPSEKGKKDGQTMQVKKEKNKPFEEEKGEEKREKKNKKNKKEKKEKKERRKKRQRQRQRIKEAKEKGPCQGHLSSYAQAKEDPDTFRR